MGDLPGGHLDPGDVGFLTSSGQRLAYVDPKEEEITAPQAAWIKGYLDDFEAALYGANFADPVLGYAPYIDRGSFIDHHILVEVTKNIDGFRLSTFMYKDRNSKLHMGPIWDYNLSLGNANYLQGWMLKGTLHDRLQEVDDANAAYWNLKAPNPPEPAPDASGVDHELSWSGQRGCEREGSGVAAPQHPGHASGDV